MALSAFAYLWDLSASGYANSFYAAAVQAATRSWKAFFFGSLDASNFITVDKPAVFLWPMDLSARIFGFNSWSMLVPEALMGVITVALVYATVRRWGGAGAGLVAGAVMAVTPVAALMFRYNNPDAMLVMLMTAGAYLTTRALEKASPKWLAAAGTMVGLAFLAKMGEALLVVPGLALAYLVCAPTGLGRRVVHLLGAGTALAVSAGWWVLIVALWPVADRPMIDGSRTNSIWDLILGYNGLSRLEGSGGGGAGGNFSGSTGVSRLFNSLMGGQASWLLPAAVAALVLGLVLTARSARTEPTRAALIVWGGWLVVAAAVFSFSAGVIHTYYTVALAPPIAALVGIGAGLLWQHRRALWGRAAAAALTALTALWAYTLLDRTPDWYPWLRPLILAMAVLGIASAGLSSFVGGRHARVWERSAGLAGLGSMALACLVGPLAFTIQTVTTAHTGSLPSAGPASATSATFGAAGGGTVPTAGSGRLSGPGGASGPSGTLDGSAGGAPSVPGAGERPGSTSGRPSGTGAGFGTGTRNGPTGGGSPGGTQTVSRALVKALEAEPTHYRWVAATDGSSNAATLELATGGDPVMAIGGFNGNGGNIPLATFERYVDQGEIHYYIAGNSGGAGGPGGAQSSESAITSWVENHFHSETIGGETVYNLTSPLTD